MSNFAIQFYQLLSSPLSVALTALVNKAVTSGFNICITAKLDDISELSDNLWEQGGAVFLPNCRVDAENAEIYPIIFSENPININAAKLLIITNGLEYQPQEQSFERILFVFDGNQAEELSNARNLWKRYRDCEVELSFYEQQENGVWSRK
jgi:DNA polymerase III subunit chi